MVKILKREKITEKITEDSIKQIPSKGINVTSGFTFLVFLSLLVRPGTDLVQNYSEMAYVFCFLYLLYYFFITN